ncbi:uncharacterized protein [Henckelia pumila]|uniref:uncharacterized protein n=1 Tax=Henckelia pumila TaxID=405737 RepID=UPI003C6DE218
MFIYGSCNEKVKNMDLKYIAWTQWFREKFLTDWKNTGVHLSCLAGCMRFLSGFAISSEEVVRVECRDQGATLECGVYACMWVECLACDTAEIWAYQRNVNMSAYRVRIAATILSDVHGLLKTI